MGSAWSCVVSLITARVIRDMPMPASSLTTTNWPLPLRASAQRSGISARSRSMIDRRQSS
jgi:hypothetical protein